MKVKNKERNYAMKVTDNMVLFWSGPFSQWHYAKFKVDGVSYNCAEQYMMAKKAEFFGDNKTKKKIMSAKSPREQKALGRKVKPFDVNKWNSVAKEIVFKGNLAKFSQNSDIKKTLLETGNKTLVEASPYDKIWGIGLGANDPKATNPGKWRGKNWLGQVLMRVRDELSPGGGKVDALV